MGLSRLSKQCRECRYVDTCEHKRMEAFAYVGEESFNTIALASTSVNAGSLASSSVIQSHDYRDIKINKGMTITIDLKESQKELTKSLYGNLMQFGG